MNLREHTIIKEYIDAKIDWATGSLVVQLESSRLDMPLESLPTAMASVTRARDRYEAAEKAFMGLMEETA